MRFGGCLFFPEPKLFITRNKNMCLYEKLVNIIQMLSKFIFKTGGSYNLMFASFRSRYVFYNIWGHFFTNIKTRPPTKSKKLSLHYEKVIWGFFQERQD